MEALATLKQHKTMGFDGIPAEAIKKDLTCRFLVKLFNMCYLKACSPKEWRKEVIFPIPKKSSSIDLNDFRGITLVSTINKTFCLLLNRRLMNWLQLREVLSEAQNGFRPWRGCIDHRDS